MTATRPMQLSMVEGMDRPTGRVLGSVFTGNNAQLMAAVAPLYLTGSVLDTTYGLGKWWDRFTPDPFTYHDLHTVDGVDFRDLPHDDASFDAVTFDPPYVPAGGSRTTGRTQAEENYRSRFGLEPRSLAELDEMIAAGLAECARVARTWLLVKCMDFVTGGAFTLGHLTILDRARELGLKPHDLIVHNTGTGPGGHNITTILRARRAHSTLLVFACGRPTPTADLSGSSEQEADR